MPKRFSSTNGWLGFSLDLARKKNFSDALRVLHKMEARGLDFSGLRLAAQVNNRCGRVISAEKCWLENAERGGMGSGDYYMLGSLQMQLEKWVLAARSFEREIEIATLSGEDYFLGVSVIRLAVLKLKLNDTAGARSVLDGVAESIGDYIHDVGYQTKVDILQEIEISEKGNSEPT